MASCSMIERLIMSRQNTHLLKSSNRFYLTCLLMELSGQQALLDSNWRDTYDFQNMTFQQFEALMIKWYGISYKRGHYLWQRNKSSVSSDIYFSCLISFNLHDFYIRLFIDKPVLELVVNVKDLGSIVKFNLDSEKEEIYVVLLNRFKAFSALFSLDAAFAYILPLFKDKDSFYQAIREPEDLELFLFRELLLTNEQVITEKTRAINIILNEPSVASLKVEELEAQLKAHREEHGTIF